MADPASWAAMVAAAEAMAAEAALATAGTAVAADTAAMASTAAGAEALAALEAGIGMGAGAMTPEVAMASFGAMAPGTELAAGLMGSGEAIPWITEAAPLAEQASIGFSAPGMTGAENFIASAPQFATASTFPWEKAAKAGMYGMAMGNALSPKSAPSGGGGRPPSGGGQSQPMPEFNYGAPTVQMPSMAELLKKREEMMRRRMARGY